MREALQITAYLAGSIALSRPEDLAFDGILASQVLRRYYGADFYHLPDPKEMLFFARLPLEMCGRPSPEMQQAETGTVWFEARIHQRDESLWYWACSSAQMVVQAHDTQYWNKRFDTQAGLSDHLDFGGKVEKIIIEQGRYKAYHMPLPTLVTDKIIWYVYGDAEQITELVQPIMAIGHKRSQGNGHVLRWSVEPVAEDWSRWKEDTLMRPIPGPLFDHAEAMPLNIQYSAYRAPQWHAMNQTMCVTKAKRHAV